MIAAAADLESGGGWRAPGDLAAFWTRQRELYRRLLDEAPLSRNAWFWRIKLRIYAFFISRYGDRLLGRLGESPGHRPLRFPAPGAAPEGGKPPMAAGKIRALLLDIRSTLRDR